MHYINGQCVTKREFVELQRHVHESPDHQGIFETMFCKNKRIPLLDFHQERFSRSLNSYNIKQINFFKTDIEIIEKPNNAVLKYQHIIANLNYEHFRLLEIQRPRLYPEEYSKKGVSLILSNMRMPKIILQTGHKNINRSFYHKIQTECLTDAYQEILILNSCEEVVEGIKSNLFAIKDDCLITPQLINGGVAGVMRAFLLQSALELGIDSCIESISIDELLDMDAVFMSNALIGIWPVKQLTINRNKLNSWSINHPITQKLVKSLPEEYQHA